MTHKQIKPNIGKRFFAGFLDYLIIYVFFIIYVFLFGKPDNNGEYSVDGILAFVPVLFWFFMTVGIEQIFGATIGNYAVSLKPISIHKNKLTLTQSFKRHILDPIDMFFFGIVGIITIKNSDKSQRLGDLWAETIVIDSKIKNIEILNDIEQIQTIKQTSIINLIKQSIFTQITLGFGILFLVYGILNEIIPIYFFWESKSVGWTFLLLGIIGILTKASSIRKKEKRKTILNKIGIGFICFIFFIQLILIIIIPNTDAYKISKEHIVNNDKIISEVGKVKGFGLIPTGSISIQTDSNGKTGNASINLIIKGEKAFKRVTVFSSKNYDTFWKVDEIK